MRILFFIFVSSLAWLAAILVASAQSVYPVHNYGKATIGGEFSLVDTHGHQVTSSDFKGRALVVYMGYSHCPDICPATLATMGRALQTLGSDSTKAAFLFITLDPDRDTPQALGRFLSAFDPRIIGLTGSKEAIAHAAGAYKVYYAKVAPNATGNYPISHSGFLYLMDMQGNYVTYFDADVKAENITGAVRKIIVGNR